MMKPYDLIVLGAGNAGLSAARLAKQAGWSVLVIEARDVGGTCPLRGCVPKKVLVAAAQTLDVIRRAGAHGIQVGTPRLDWARLVERAQSFTQGVSEDLESSLSSRDIDLVKGAARFVDRRIVEVEGRRYEGRYVLVATGSKPRQLTLPGHEHLVTSEHLLSNPELPRAITFIGAGVVAMELGHVFARAGSQVTLLEMAPQPLTGLDPSAVERLVQYSRDIGIRIECGVSFRSLVQTPDGLELGYQRGNSEHVVVSDAVANGAGRVANIEELQLGAAQVSVEAGRVQLDAQLRSRSNNAVYFAGDVVSGAPQLSPTASMEGSVAATNILGRGPLSPDYTAVPSAIYTVPALAQVGLTEARAQAADLEFRVIENDMRTWRSARTYAEDIAYAKVLVAKDTGKILGAHLLGHGSEETIHAFAFAIKHGLTGDDIANSATAYPTFHADLKYLVQ